MPPEPHFEKGFFKK